MKVLILCYDFPPLISIGGQRPNSWFNYLPEQGIGVTIVTRHWNSSIREPIDYVQPTSTETTIETDARGNSIVRVPYFPNKRDQILLRFGFKRFELIRKILSSIYSFMEYVSFAFDSRSAIYFEADKLIAKAKPDLIIATGEPWIVFKYAHLLAAKHHVKWVADYRDGWTTNQGDYQSGWIKKTQANFFRLMEKKYLSNAWFITTAAPTYAKLLAKIHPEKEVHTVYNGYDEKHFQNLADVKQERERFVVTYAGYIYPHQNLELFLAGLQLFVTKENISPDNFEVRFYGLDVHPPSKVRLMNYSETLNPFLVTIPKISYDEMVKKMCSSHLLLLLSRKGADWLNGKMFDYLASKRKILLVENDEGIMEKMLRDTDGGIAVSSAEEVAEVLKTEFENFRAGKETTVPVNDFYKKYSRKTQAFALAELLKKKFKAS